jgi:hypothetical protein
MLELNYEGRPLILDCCHKNHHTVNSRTGSKTTLLSLCLFICSCNVAESRLAISTIS